MRFKSRSELLGYCRPRKAYLMTCVARTPISGAVGVDTGEKIVISMIRVSAKQYTKCELYHTGSHSGTDRRTSATVGPAVCCDDQPDLEPHYPGDEGLRIPLKHLRCHGAGLTEPPCPAEHIHEEGLIRPCPGGQAFILIPCPPQEVCGTSPADPGRHIRFLIVAGPRRVEGCPCRPGRCTEVFLDDRPAEEGVCYSREFPGVELFPVSWELTVSATPSRALPGSGAQ